MAMRILKPLVRWGGYYPSKKYTPLVYPGGYTTMDAAIGPLDPLNTFSGDIVRFTTKRGLPMQSLKVNMSPIQDLHGQDAPYPAGGGKNLLNVSHDNEVKINGGNLFDIVYGDNNSCSMVNVQGVAALYVCWELFEITSDMVGKKITKSLKDGNILNFLFRVSDDNWATNTALSSVVVTYTIQASDVGKRLGMSIYNSSGADVTFTEMQVEFGDTATAFAPYENICPISGYTGVEAWRTGKNLLDPTYRQNLTSNIRFYITNGLLLKANTTYTFSVSSPSAQNQITDKNDGTSLAVNYGRNYLTYTPTTDVLAWFDVYYAGNYPVPSGGTSAIDCQLELGSTATDYEPYNGNSYSVTFPSVNIWDEEWEVGLIDTSTGENIPSNNNIRSKNNIPVLPNTAYYFKATLRMSVNGAYYDADGNYISAIGDIANNVFTTPPTAHYMKFYLASAYGTIYNNDISINYPSIAREYYAYGEPLIVYGGTPDIVSGEMPITMAEVDMGSLNWLLLSADKHLFYAYVADIKENTSASAIPNLLSDRYKTVSASAVFNAFQDFTIGQGVNGIVGAKYVMAVNTAYSDAASFKTAMRGVQLVYELATPIEIQLTPQQVAALKGYNAVWSDAGPVEVTAYGTPIVEPDVQPLQALNLLLGGAYRSNHTPEDVSDEEALDILLGGADR